MGNTIDSAFRRVDESDGKLTLEQEFSDVSSTSLIRDSPEGVYSLLNSFGENENETYAHDGITGRWIVAGRFQQRGSAWPIWIWWSRLRQRSHDQLWQFARVRIVWLFECQPVPQSSDPDKSLPHIRWLGLLKPILQQVQLCPGLRLRWLSPSSLSIIGVETTDQPEPSVGSSIPLESRSNSQAVSR